MQFGLLVLVAREWVQITGLRRSERMQSRSLISENAAVPSLHVPIVVDEFCLPVKLSPRRSLLAASRNMVTSQPGHGVFACLCMVPEDPGDATMWK